MSFWEHSKLNHLSDTSDFQCKINSSWIISQCSEKWANYEWKTACETFFRKNSENRDFEKYQNNYMWIFCEIVKVCVRFHKELQFCLSLCDFGHFWFGIFLGQMGQMKNNLTQAFLTIWPKIFPFFIFQLSLEKSPVFIVIATIVRYIFLLNIIKNNTKNTNLGQMGQINPKTFLKKSFRIWQ